jgi:spore coat protein JB
MKAENRKGLTRMYKNLKDEYYSMLQELQSVDFVLVELTLYLDTHPLDAQAVQEFNQFSQKRQFLANQYEAKFGPLLQFGRSYTRYPWQWADTPWPWQV